MNENTSNIQNKINSILQVLENDLQKCSYYENSRKYLVQAFKEILEYKKNIPSKYQIINFQSEKLFFFNIYLPIFYKAKNFDISIQILFPRNYPYIPPKFILDAPKGTGINIKNKNINSENRLIFTEEILNISFPNEQLITGFDASNISSSDTSSTISSSSIEFGISISSTL